MGIYDRDYNRDQYGNAGGRMQLVMPPVTPVVKWLLIINIVIYVVSVIMVPVGKFLFDWFSVSAGSLWQPLQLWRVISYQFLHDTDRFFHIFFNMLVLFFFGPMLEQLWGSKRFIKFYLFCGALGGFVYPILVLTGVIPARNFVGDPIVLVGASGAIYGMLAAGAILFPKMRVYVFGIFPIPMGILAVMMVFFSLFGFLQGENAGGEAAHLAGMAGGAIYLLYKPWMNKVMHKKQKGAWEKKVADQCDFQKEVDRILEKVHSSGIASLTRKEKQILKKATEQQQK